MRIIGSQGRAGSFAGEAGDVGAPPPLPLRLRTGGEGHGNLPDWMLQTQALTLDALETARLKITPYTENHFFSFPVHGRLGTELAARHPSALCTDGVHERREDPDRGYHWLVNLCGSVSKVPLLGGGGGRGAHPLPAPPFSPATPRCPALNPLEEHHRGYLEGLPSGFQPRAPGSRARQDLRAR